MKPINRCRLVTILLTLNVSGITLAEPSIQFIHDIQGSGPEVTNRGALTTVQAIVTGDYQLGDQLDGFFLQEEDADADGDPSTSEGIFVFCGSCDVAVEEGDVVEVTGIQDEFFGMSQIDATGDDARVEVISSSSGLVSPSAITLPAASGTDQEATFEAYEGMLVQFSDELTVTETFQLARFGQLVLSQGGKLRQFTDMMPPSISGYAAHQGDIAKRTIILDDHNNIQNVDPVFHPQPGGFSVDNLVRSGDTVSGLSGVLHWSWAGSGGTDAWRVRPQLSNPVAFTPGPQRPAALEPVGGRLSIASLNVFNYFTTIDNGSNDGCGPDSVSRCRGADSADELQRQTSKLVAALSKIDADVLGVIEIENNHITSLNQLVSALNGVVGADTYSYIDTGTIGTDAIKAGLIYRSASVAPVGSFTILDNSVDPDFDDVRNRPVLIQTFVENGSGERITIAVNHLKSKGAACTEPDLNDGQGGCNLTRTSAAQALVEYLATDPTASGDPDFLIIGDLNAYAMEDPITAIHDAGYTNLVAAFGGTAPYSFVFAGQWGYLDHAMATKSLATQVTGVTAWHINADEANLLDYNDEIQDIGEKPFEAKPASTILYSPDPYRSSDHDPIVIGLNLSSHTLDSGACKKSGWQSEVRADGSSFENQGQCVKYVKTGK